jgi:hypothetical protein
MKSIVIIFPFLFFSLALQAQQLKKITPVPSPRLGEADRTIKVIQTESKKVDVPYYAPFEGYKYVFIAGKKHSLLAYADTTIDGYSLHFQDSTSHYKIRGCDWTTLYINYHCSYIDPSSKK